MTKEEVMRFHKAEPFQPFNIRLADGKAHMIPHREFLSYSHEGHTVIAHGIYGDFAIVDVRHVTAIEVFRSATDTDAA